jgi:hypothetical protein
MQVCQRWYSCRKHCWNILTGNSRTASLVALTTSDDWNLLSSFERERNRMVRDQVSTEGEAKWLPVALPVSLASLQPKASSPYTCFNMLNVSLGDLPSFWQNLMSARCSNCHNFDFRHSHLTAVHRKGSSSAYTVCTQLPLAVMRNELTGHHIVSQPAAVHSNDALRPVHELIVYGSISTSISLVHVRLLQL